VRRFSTLAVLAIFMGPVVHAQDAAKTAKTSKTAKPQTKTEKMSYAIGADIGRNLKNNRISLSITQFFAGIGDAFAGKPLALDDKELRSSIVDFQTAMSEGAQKRADELAQKNLQMAQKNLQDGKAFLATNAKKEGVTTTASGLQYRVIRAGKGKTPKATDTVVTHYEGSLINGKVFDSSIKRGEPTEFSVNRVIKGWTEALQLMKVGDKWQLFIPSKLAYGTTGSGQDIGPNMTLIFDIELIKIK